ASKNRAFARDRAGPGRSPDPAPSLRDDLPLPERSDDAPGSILGRARAGVDDDLRALRHLVGRVDPGEVLDLALEGPGVESFGIALLADLERRIHVDLDELALADELAHHAPLRAEGGDERAEHDGAGIDEEARDF